MALRGTQRHPPSPWRRIAAPGLRAFPLAALALCATLARAPEALACSVQVDALPSGGAPLRSPDRRWELFARPPEGDYNWVYLRRAEPRAKPVRIAAYYRDGEYFWTGDNRFLIFHDFHVDTDFLRIFRVGAHGAVLQPWYEKAIHRRMRAQVPAGRALFKYFYSIRQCDRRGITLFVSFEDEPLKGGGPLRGWHGKLRIDLVHPRVTDRFVAERY